MAHDDFSVQFGIPQHGWLQVRIEGSDSTVEFVASHLIDDSMHDLISALNFILLGSPHQSIKWELEPEQIEFRFTKYNEGLLLLQVIKLPNPRTNSSENVNLLFEYVVSYYQICIAFWRALRRLETSLSLEEYKAQWHHEFPTTALRQLAHLIRLVS